MKVILLEELKGRGGEGDVIDVARGFAVNYLLPRKIAIEATSGNLKQLEQRMHNIKKREDNRIGDANALVNKLEGKAIRIEARVGDEGRLFGSITTPMIEDAIKEQLGVEVDRRKIDTHGPIKQAGEHTVDVQVYRDIRAHLTVNVVAEGAVAETVVVEVEGVSTEGEPFVHVAAETAEQAEADLALEEASEEAAGETAE